MNSRGRITFRVTCVVDKNKIIAHVTIDKKNKSVHLHLYGEIFGKKSMPIQVKNSNTEFKEGKETALLMQILTGHFAGQPFQIDTIEESDDQEDFSTMGKPVRIIVRLKG